MVIVLSLKLKMESFEAKESETSANRAETAARDHRRRICCLWSRCVIGKTAQRLRCRFYCVRNAFLVIGSTDYRKS